MDFILVYFREIISERWEGVIHYWGIMHSSGAFEGKSFSAQNPSAWRSAGALRRTQSRYHGHEIDHDGKATTKDMAMFHEMMDESNKGHDTAYKSTWDLFCECLMLLLLVFAIPLLFLNAIGFIGNLFG